MTKDEIMSLLEEFYQLCRADENKTIAYFSGFMMAAFAEIASNPELIETELEIIKDKINEIKSQTNEAGKADLIN